jgi:hypothetical protein
MLHLPAVLALAAAAPANVAGVEKLEFGSQTITKWSYILPDERWSSVHDEIPIPHDGQTGFVVREDGPMKLAIDSDGDGRTDVEVNGVKGNVTLRGRDADGRAFHYPVRLVNDGQRWKYASGGVLKAGTRGFSITLIDQDNDGRYDGYGKDAMIVGSGDAASLLSEVVNLGGDLFKFRMGEDGRTADLEPYAGDYGTIDAKAQFQSFGKLVAAVVRDGNVSFNLADVDSGPMKVPAGTYSLVSGFAARGTETVQIRPGRMPDIEVAPAGVVALSWGAPVAAEFDFKVAGETITVQPDVKFYGTAGEEYHTFTPNAKSPKLVVLDKKSRKELASGRFGGC